jgi:hypothetical protein
MKIDLFLFRFQGVFISWKKAEWILSSLFCYFFVNFEAEPN